MNHTTLELDRTEPGVLLVIINRPEVRNAINSVMMAELNLLWTGLKDDRATSCVVLTGKGKAFCAGADLKERNGLTVERWLEHHSILEDAMAAMLSCPIPVLAAVNGAAFGGGLELALASDCCYASTEASFGMPETKIGIMPGAMGTQNLPRACGARRAKEICYTGTPFSSEEALKWGIVNRIYEPVSLLGEVLQIARSIRANAPLAVRSVKKAINDGSELTIAAGYQVELEAYRKLIPTGDREEGIRAFNEKRLPQFGGS